jgi:sulfonate transport system permease protein
LPWGVPLLLVILWQALAAAGWIPTRILPAPSAVFAAGLHLIQTGDLPQYIAVSAQRAFLGFLIGGSLGFTLGLACGLSRTAAALLDGSIQMVRNVPHLALIPLVILWFGIGEEAKIFLVALGTLFPIYLNTYYGIRTVDAGLVEMGRVYRLSRWQLFVRVVLLGALPSILVGVRYALGVTWLTLIVAETIASDFGLGYMAMNASEFMQMDVVVLSIVLYALLGKLSDVLARLLERRWLRWHPSYQRA